MNESAALVKMPLAKLARITLGALVVTEVHTRDLVEELIANDVTDINNFSWISQLRYEFLIVQLRTNFTHEFLIQILL